MQPIEIIAQDVFEKVRSRFTNLKIGDENGSITANPKDARFFDFDFAIEENTLGRVSISINELGSLKVFYSQSITEDADPVTQQAWYDFLREMRYFAKRRLLRFDTRDITKGNLDKTDFKYLAKKKSKDSTMNESAMYGSLKTSRRTVENTNLIIRHSEAIDPYKPGARSRKINKMYIENRDGERFLLPHNHLPYGRAMQRHVASGGYPYDDIGKEITKTCENILKLSDFSRKVKHFTLNDSAHNIIEHAGAKLQNLRHHMEGLSRQKYYQSWVESYEGIDDSLIEMDEVTLATYKDAFTVTRFDETLADVFPLLHSIMQETSEIDLDEIVEGSLDDADDRTNYQSEFAAFESWTDDLMQEGFSDEELEKLEPLVKQALPVGANDEAIQALLGVGFRDQKLFDALKAISDMPNGSEADARDVIKAFLGKDGEKLDWGDMEAPADVDNEVPVSEPEPDEEMPPEEELPPEEPMQQPTQQSVQPDSTRQPQPPVSEEDEDRVCADKKEKKANRGSKIKEIAKILSGFFNREDGTWTRGEQGVITHVKRQFSNDKGEGGEKEASMAAQLISHLNQKHKESQEVQEMRRLAGLPVIESKKPSSRLSKKKKTETVKKVKR